VLLGYIIRNLIARDENFVTEFLEMRVESEGRTDARPPHDFETRAIDEAQGAATEEDFSTLREYLGSQTIYNLEESLGSYAKAAKIFFDLRRKGMSVRSSMDCLIAQTAIEHGLHLLHNDSDFDRIARVSALKIW
jgi:hypothetical protein